MNFPSDSFPPAVRDVIDGLPSIVGSRPEFGGLAALFAGSLLGARVRLRVKNNWFLPTNLYLAIVAPKGEAKSPAIKFLTGPLLDHFGKQSSDYLANLAKWEEKVKNLLRTKDGAAQRSRLDEEKPEFPWWGIVTDGTVEGIRKVASENHEAGHPSRICRYNDELDGWIQNMSRYSEGSDMAFYLQAHDGDIHIKANKGEKSACPPITLSLIGTIQPEIFSQSFGGNNTHNGLLDRIMISSGVGDSPVEDIFEEWEDGVLERYKALTLEILEDLPHMDLDFPDDCRDGAREFLDKLRGISDRHNCGAFPKWKQHYFKVLAILAVWWQRDKIDADLCERAEKLSLFFVGCWVRSFKDMGETDIGKAVERIKEKLEENGGFETISGIKKWFNAGNRGVAGDALNFMEDEDIITLENGRSRNGKTVMIARLSHEE